MRTRPAIRSKDKHVTPTVANCAFSNQTWFCILLPHKMISTLMWASNSALMAAYDARCAGAMGETRGEASSKPQRYLILSPPTAAVQQTGYEDRRPGAFVRRNSVVVPSIWKHSQMSPPSSVGIARVIHAKYGRGRKAHSLTWSLTFRLSTSTTLF